MGAGSPRETWATDVLKERSYVWLLISRLLFLTAGSLLVNFVVIYLSRAFGMTKEAGERRCSS